MSNDKSKRLADIQQGLSQVFSNEMQKFNASAEMEEIRSKQPAYMHNRPEPQVRSVADTQAPSIKIDGFRLPLSGIGLMDMVTMLSYIIISEGNNNPRIEAILEKFAEQGMKFCDLDGQVIFPRKAKGRKRKK